MKLFNFFLSYYYNVEVKNSETQLGQDFGYFPPIPLDCAPLKKEFTIVRVRGLGIFYFQWKVSEKIIKLLKNDPSSISREFIQQCGHENFYSLSQVLQNLHKNSKFLAKIAILFMTLKMARMAIASIIKKSNGVGVFTPLTADESNIVILTSRLKGRSEESIVSHEHIHFLQHRSPEVHNRYVKSPKKLLSDKYSQISYCLYQLEKKEVEARLHEFILSFYRVNFYIPSTVRGFLGLIATSSQFDWPVYDSFKLHQIDYESTIDSFTVRDSILTDELLTIFQWIKTDELRIRFLTEVLTVMYGNLLRYYGDIALSQSIIAEIPRPNYYDELYGL